MSDILSSKYEMQSQIKQGQENDEVALDLKELFQ